MQRIVKGDLVVVIAGKGKGAKGNVLRVVKDKKSNMSVKVIVSGVNVRFKCVKSKMSDSGGVVEKECPIDVSNVALLCKHTKQPSRVAYKYLSDGNKIRLYKKSMECVE